jgi:hypothetical protein
LGDDGVARQGANDVAGGEPTGQSDTMMLPPREHERVAVQADIVWGRPLGSVLWWEHMIAYDDAYPRGIAGQSPEQLASRGGFTYGELVRHLKRVPVSWMPGELRAERLM